MDQAAAAAPTAPAPERKPRRSTYLVDRAFQLKYTFGMMAIGGLLTALFGWWMWEADRQVTQILVLQDALRPLVEQSDKHVAAVLVGIGLLMVSALGLFGVLITHRVSGPIYVMSHYLSALAQGRYPRMRALRKRDELKRFFEQFQGAVAAMKERDEKEAAALEDAVARMTAAAAKAPELQPAIDALTAVARRKREAVSGGTPS